MKYLLFLLLGANLSGEPLWIPKGFPVPSGLVKANIANCCASMKPALQGGEVCYLEKVTPETKLQIGDIVDTGKATHRITAMNKRAVYTSGDANMWPDGWTLRKDLLWVVRFVERP